MVLSTILTLRIVTLPCKVFQILLITSALCYQEPNISSPSKVLNPTHAHIYIYNTNIRLHFHRFKLAFPLMSFPLKAVDTIGNYSKYLLA